MIRTETELEELLTKPSPADTEALAQIDGDILLLGAGGKMGPTMARRIRLASDLAGKDRRVIAVSRFSNSNARESLESHGVECVSCDLLCRESVDQLPSSPNVLYLVGRKFGTSDRTDLTWAANTIAPTYVAHRFREARIVVFSTGNVYPLRTMAEGGCDEQVAMEPHGEYAISAVGRERVFEYFSRQFQTKTLIVRLNYAVDLRYGVLVDIATRVFQREPVNVSVPYFNVIWQGDANSYGLRALLHCESPPRVLNVTGERVMSVRETANWFGARFGLAVEFCGVENDRSLLSDASRCFQQMGRPDIDEWQLCEMVASWIEHGGRSLNLPTKFDVASGRF